VPGTHFGIFFQAPGKYRHSLFFKVKIAKYNLKDKSHISKKYLYDLKINLSQINAS